MTHEPIWTTHPAIPPIPPCMASVESSQKHNCYCILLYTCSGIRKPGVTPRPPRQSPPSPTIPPTNKPCPSFSLPMYTVLCIYYYVSMYLLLGPGPPGPDPGLSDYGSTKVPVSNVVHLNTSPLSLLSFPSDAHCSASSRSRQRMHNDHWCVSRERAKNEKKTWPGCHDM